MPNRTISPDIKHAVDFHSELKPLQTWTLDNGVKVYALHAGEEDVVHLEWVFYAGNSWENKRLNKKHRVFSTLIGG
jgi:zinc protease